MEGWEMTGQSKLTWSGGGFSLGQNWALGAT